MSETVWEFRSVGPDEMQLDTTPGFTDAERGKLAEFEAAEEPEEIRVERVAMAISAAWVDRWPNDNEPWELLREAIREDYRFMAVAAIAALDPS